jgi:hypothetical protein
MNRLIPVSAALALAVSLAGCNTPEGQNAANGAVLGGAAGALIGGAATGHLGGALAGGAIGAATGATVGAAATPHDYYGPGPGYGPDYGPGPRPRCAEFYYDYNGNRVCRAYY